MVDLGDYTLLLPGQLPLTGRASMELAPGPSLPPLTADLGSLEMTFEGDFSGLEGWDLPMTRDAVQQVRETIEAFLQQIKSRGAIYDLEIETRPDRPGELWITLPPPPTPLELIVFPVRFDLTFPGFVDLLTFPMPACKKRSRRSRRRWRGHLKSQGLRACTRASTR